MRLRNLSLLAALLAVSCSVQAEPKFSVVFPPSAFSGAFSGRVVIYLANTTAKEEPRLGPDWSDPQPMYSAKFTNIKAEQQMVITDANAIGFPSKIAALPDGEYEVQAVVDRNLGGRAIGTSPGNLYSDVQHIRFSGSRMQSIVLVCSHIASTPTFQNANGLREFSLQSKLLSDWYHRPTFIHAAVVLPA